MTAATELFETTSAALVITGAPEWGSPDDANEREVLVYLADEAGNSGPLWALHAPTDRARKSCRRKGNGVSGRDNVPGMRHGD